MLRRTLLQCAALGTAATVFGAHAAARKTLLVYTAVEPEWLAVYRDAFALVRPDIDITYVRASAGPISARLLAEKDHPRADVVFGLSAIAMENLRVKGLLTPYAPQGIDKLNSKMVERGLHWFGMNAWGGSLCVNTDLLKRKGLAVPKSWHDLLSDCYKGQIVMPSPKASSTGYMFFLGWLQGFGSDKGWDYIEKLHRNMLFYTSSGFRPAAMAAQGEIPIGLSADAFVKPFLRFDIPVESIEPLEGIAWDAEASALPAGCPNPQEAKAFLDFCAGPQVAEIAARFSGIAAREGFSTPKGRAIADRFLPLDFGLAAAEKADIINRWQALVSR